MPGIRAITVYCGSADGLNPEFLQAAHCLGQALAVQGITLIYGGGKTGLMGAVADGALSRSGSVIGVMPEIFNTPVLCHDGLTRLELTPDIHTRFARMVALADAFIALPGGFGTFDELFQTLTWAQVGLHAKPVGLLNVRGYFDPLLAMLDHCLAEKFIFPEHRAWVNASPDAETLLDALEAFQVPAGIDRWVNR